MLDLEAIKARDVLMGPLPNGVPETQWGRSALEQAIRDRRILIAEVGRLRAALRRFVDGMQPGQRIGCPEDWESELNEARRLLEKE